LVESLQTTSPADQDSGNAPESTISLTIWST
jgi:hypothetical protein